jgi:hypothetical protein
VRIGVSEKADDFDLLLQFGRWECDDSAAGFRLNIVPWYNERQRGPSTTRECISRP